MRGRSGVSQAQGWVFALVGGVFHPKRDICCPAERLKTPAKGVGSAGPWPSSPKRLLCEATLTHPKEPAALVGASVPSLLGPPAPPTALVPIGSGLPATSGG